MNPIKFTIDNFVGIFDNAFDAEYCKDLVEYFEQLRSLNHVKNQEEYTTRPGVRKDESVFLMAPDVITIPKSSPLLQKFSDIFWACYDEYCKEFDILKGTNRHGFTQLRVQRTDPGGGFHLWHFENTGNETSNRLITFMFYLNDVEDGGETEFLYLHKRIKPQLGRLLIWPSTFSHTHRGNPPLSSTKYIATGWLTYFD